MLILIYWIINMDKNVEDSLLKIKRGCDVWITHHKDETLWLDYKSVEELYDLLTELEDMIRGTQNG